MSNKCHPEVLEGRQASDNLRLQPPMFGYQRHAANLRGKHFRAVWPEPDRVLFPADVRPADLHQWVILPKYSLLYQFFQRSFERLFGQVGEVAPSHLAASFAW